MNILKRRIMGVVKRKEVWKDVPGYEGLYRVSNYGNCKRLSRTFKHPVKLDALLKEMILSNTRNNAGYVCWTMYKEGNKKAFTAHRLVSLLFVSNPGNLPHVNHRNGVKSYNYYLNLEWVNHRENISHRYKGVKRTSALTGVFVHKKKHHHKESYRSQINIKGKSIHLGNFGTEKEAHQAYLMALKKYDLKNKYSGR